MARVAYADPEGNDEVRQLASQIQAERGGRLLNLYRMLLQSPPMADGWRHLLTTVRYEGQLDGNSRELAICLVARLTGAEYEWRAHAALAVQVGLSQAQVDALGAWRESTLFDQRQRAVLAYAEEMTREVRVRDETFAAIAGHLRERELVELTITVGAYNMVSRVLVALAVDMEQGA